MSHDVVSALGANLSVISTNPGAYASRPRAGCPSPRRRGGSGTGGGADDFLASWGHAWVPGHLSLDADRLVFAPSRPPRTRARLELRLADVRSVETTGSYLPNVAVVRTATHLVRWRCYGAVAFAELLIDHLTDRLSHDWGDELAEQAGAGSLGRVAQRR